MKVTIPTIGYNTYTSQAQADAFCFIMHSVKCAAIEYFDSTLDDRLLILTRICGCFHVAPSPSDKTLQLREKTSTAWLYCVARTSVLVVVA